MLLTPRVIDSAERARAVTDELRRRLAAYAARHGALSCGNVMAGSNRGIALISVLWITGLLAVMAASFASSTRTEARLARNQEENAKAEALADAGVHRAVFGLLDFDPETRGGPAVTSRRSRWAKATCRSRVEDEDGKIDLNAAPLELIEGLLRGARAARRGGAADGRSDRRLPRSRTASPSRSAPRTTPISRRPPAGRRRPAVRDGKRAAARARHDAELYERVRPYVTVYSGAEGVDITRASRPVLEALPGITPSVVEALLTAGARGSTRSVLIGGPAAPGGARRSVVPSREVVFTIRALGRTSGGGHFLRQAVIELDPGRDQPFLIYAWSRGTLPDNAG